MEVGGQLHYPAALPLWKDTLITIEQKVTMGPKPAHTLCREEFMP
jgi:hypothetical protein